MIFTTWQKYKIKKTQQANLERRKSGSYTKANKIGIIYHNDDLAKIDEAEKLATLLKMDGKLVKTMAYEHKNSIKHLPYDTISKSNFDFWGKFRGKPLLDFTSAEFDFLICLDRQPNNFIKSILAESLAKCRIGRYSEENQNTFEMLFDDSNGGNQWVEKLYQYIKKLA